MQDTVESLPPRQREVLRLIAELTEAHQYPPTLAELAQAMGLRNKMTVHQHVAALKKKGFVHWEPGLNRSLKVTRHCEESGDDVSVEIQQAPVARRGIRLVGTIAAGAPIDAIETDEYLDIDNNYGDSCFALKIKGDSMIEDGIYDGDYVIIRPQPSPRNGDIVVALLPDGTATLKHFYKEKGRFRLQPANSTMEPITLDPSEDLAIQGIAVGLFRKL